MYGHSHKIHILQLVGKAVNDLAILPHQHTAQETIHLMATMSQFCVLTI